MKTSAQAAMATIDRFIQEVGVAEKQAAAPKSEPGSIGGATTHPVKNVDDNLHEVPEGARSKENTADVKKDQGKPSVEHAPEAKEGTKKASVALDLSRFAKPLTKQAEGKSADGGIQSPGSAAEDHLQIGTKKAPTGDDPAVETGSVKRDKDNPETTHPTGGNIPQDGPQGGKSASDMSLEELAKEAADLANSICEELATTQGTPAAPAQTTKTASAPSISEAELASQAGWELAGLISGNFDKQAADAMVQNAMESIIKTASDDADNVARYLGGFFSQMNDLQKQAAGMGGPEQDPSSDPAAMMNPAAGGGVPMGGEAAGGGGGEGAMMSALGGEQGGPEGGPAAGGEGGGADQQAMELAHILEQLGVTPEELEAALAEEGGAGGAGGAGAPGAGPDAGGGEEMGNDESGGASLPMKAGSDKGAGNTKTAAVKKGNTRDGVREYITEVLARSRRK